MRPAIDHILVRLIALAATLVTFSSASAVTPAILIGPDLKPREVNLQAIGGGKMTYFDADRTMQVAPTGSVLQIRFLDDALLTGFIDAPELELTDIKTAVEVPDKGTLLLGGSRLVADASAPPAPPAPSKTFVELIDGQRLVGTYLGSDDEGQKLRFRHESFGEATINLDKVSRLVFEGPRDARPTPKTDLVLLSNGDSIDGFVVAVTSTGIELQQGDAKPFTLPRDRVKALILVNPMARAAGKKHMAWLRDGSRLLADELSISADKLSMASSLAAKPFTLPLAQVARIELASLAGRLVDLADLPMKVTAGGSVFGLAMPPRIEADVIRLHAPVTVEFALPDHAARFAAVAQLDADGADAVMASFIVHVRAGGDTAARHAISLAQPRAAINVPINAGALTIELDPAANGPVLDRLRLRDAMVFIETP